MENIELCNCDQSIELQETIDLAYVILTGKQFHKIENSIRCLQSKVSKKVKKTLAG